MGNFSGCQRLRKRLSSRLRGSSRGLSSAQVQPDPWLLPPPHAIRTSQGYRYGISRPGRVINQVDYAI
ncbi:hypothetical protein OIU77_030022 [Salix suchowensis]|uniref:Uncharacterized protein n=1 Tax=Salix suchowensis TaxID=1278906 RepID=A0ABQ9BC95_9ROSI|nr:hypothetical protein OIU77_030022 [Salix suchowensis]